MALLTAPLPLYYATAAAAAAATAVVLALPSTVASETGGAVLTAFNHTLATASSALLHAGVLTDVDEGSHHHHLSRAVSAVRAASSPNIEPSSNPAILGGFESPAAFVDSSNVSVEVVTGATDGPTVDDGRYFPFDRDPLESATGVANRSLDSTVPSPGGFDQGTEDFVRLVDNLFSSPGSPPDLTARQLDQGLPRAMEEHFLIANWQDCVVVILFCLLIVVTVIGNTLVILSVITTRRLRTVTNCFVMSLAVADWLVGIFVMPPAVAVHLMGSWQLGWILCDIWISLDVLLCTASILSLCAISIDRYLAVTQPLNYSRRRRSKRLALLMILVVWVLALAITCPPILGWYEPGRRELDQCRYNQNEGYVVFSAMGSFFIPMTVMVYVYLRISCVVASRHDKMTEIEVHKKSHRIREPEEDGYQSEQDPIPLSPKRKRSSSQLSTGTTTYVAQVGPGSMLEESGPKGAAKRNHKNGHYELVDMNSTVGGGIVVGGGKTTILSGAALEGAAYEAGLDEGEAVEPPVCVDPGQPGAGSGPEAGYSKLPSTDERWPSGNSVFNQQTHKPQSHAGVPVAAVAATTGGGGLRRNNTINTSTCSSVQLVGGRVTAGGGNNIRVHQKSLSSRISSMKRENKTTQTLSIVVGGFIACWLPFFINYIITPFLPKGWSVPELGEFFTWLGWINSAINPFIYAFYSVDFRAAFWRLTLRRFFRNSEKAPFANIHNLSMRR
ncbi:AGAP013324-PA-like protein [Anopheles sinensis]|uniref:AGAP013324-PA-like protein n=1 Tax=Anopheles sinensis TaxID=74873 RepID=A0A084VTK0_ANOSI|nr:AGAP013324-PA-like protein [Anopheles sinensis]